MSKEKPSANKAAKNTDAAPDLSALDFGPAWARDKPKRSQHSSRDNQKKGGYPSGGKGRAPQRRDDRRSSNGRDFNKGGRVPRKYTPPVAAPEGVSARIMPIEEGLDAMAKQILDTGRTHSVFELAWVVLGSRDRFHVVFDSEKEIFFSSQTNRSVWLSQTECLANFWVSGLYKTYYDEKVIEVEAPAGNFPSVARCGLSKKLIGPPNHHAYQQSVIDLHREQFAHMDIERYKSSIIVENSEEVVQEWLDSMKQSLRWSPKAAAPVGDAPEEEAVAAEAETVFATRREVEQHFLANEFSKEYALSKVASVLANTPANALSPGLMTLLKTTATEEKRYPGNLASILCRQMTGRHLAVFKWKKRLHCGPARPKLLADGVVMADRPAALYKWVVENPSGNIDKMWKDCLPTDVDDQTKQLWYHDLHWLINEGQVLLFSDGKLHTAKAKNPEVKKQAQPKKTEAPKPIAKKTEFTVAEVKPADEVVSEKKETPEGDAKVD